MTVMLPKFT
uniref:Uncharacterized protein n=1 Tax=Rhizophora mucronata TaxID=61149 RepID=A0A2P2LXS7_RHIMU